MKVSFCTTCKGRLWQLRETLPYNVNMLEDDCEIILLDYHSEDGLKEFVFEHYQEELENGILKYFYLTHDYKFTMSYAKNVAHKLATGEILFNLDGDNLIYEGMVDELRKLRSNEIFIPRYDHREKEGSYGRLGYRRELFYSLNGYDETIVGMLADDYDLVQRSKNLPFPVKYVRASKVVEAIQNTRAQKDLFVNVTELETVPVNYPEQWGVATVLDRHAKVIEL